MYIVRGSFPDYSKPDNKGSFALNPDKSMNYQTWAPPIIYVNGTEVKFKQISNSAIDETDFDLSAFPQQYKSSISYIIEAIDKAMKVMD